VIKHLYDRGLLPGHTVKVIDAAPLQGPLTLLVDQKEVVLGLSLAEFVIVE
jgi:Fe2+ transport system protein FeoA